MQRVTAKSSRDLFGICELAQANAYLAHHQDARPLCVFEASKRFGLEAQGVIHVGMSDAAMIERYRKAGFKSIIVLEADPDCVNVLIKRSFGAGVRLEQVAVTNFNGYAWLNRTELPGCSSLLDYGRYLENYPILERVPPIQVRAATLQSILDTADLKEAEKWILCLDAEGSEFKILEGAGSVLEMVEAIFLPLYREEAYCGVTKGSVVDRFLRDTGFNRAAERPDGLGLGQTALYVRRPVLTMSTLGRNGRFANQLFQYLFLRIAARETKMCLQIPVWAGRDFYDCDEPQCDQVPTTLLRESFEEKGVEDGIETSWKGWAERVLCCEFGGGHACEEGRDLWGYFQCNMRIYSGYKAFIRALFSPRETTAERLREVMGTLEKCGKKIIAVHLRRGDYGNGIFFRSPCSWYEQWIEKQGFDPAQYMVYVSSEDAEVYRGRFKGFEVWTSKMLGLLLSVEDFLVDFYIMSNCDVLAISNSTFSFMASLLNKRCKNFFRPSPESMELVSYDPWDSDPLIRCWLPPESHRRFSEVD